MQRHAVTSESGKKIPHLSSPFAGLPAHISAPSQNLNALNRPSDFRADSNMVFSVMSLWLFCPCIERVRLRTFTVPLLSKSRYFRGVQYFGNFTVVYKKSWKIFLDTVSLIGALYIFDYRDRCLITITGRQSTLNDTCTVINIVFKLHSLSPLRRPLRLALGKKKPSSGWWEGTQRAI